MLLNKEAFDLIFKTPKFEVKKTTNTRYGNTKPADKNMNIVLSTLKALKICTVKDISEKTGINKSAISICMAALKVENKVEHHGILKVARTRSIQWKLKDKIVNPC